MHRIIPSLILLGLFLLLPAPALASSTLIVQVRTDLTPSAGFDSVRTTVTGEDECGNHVQFRSIAAAGHDWSRGVRVAEIPKLKKGTIRATVSALDRDGRVVAERPVRAQVGDDGVRVVTVLLVGQNCEADRRNALAQCQMQEARCRSTYGNKARLKCRQARQLCGRRVESEYATCSGGTASSDPGLEGLWLVITTGGDDLRGGSDNVDVTVRLKNGRTERVGNANRSRSWGNQCTNYVHVPFSSAVRSRRDIESVTLTTSFGGGMGGDNWNIDRIAVLSEAGNRSYVIRAGRPLVRLTGDQRTFSLRW